MSFDKLHDRRKKQRATGEEPVPDELSEHGIPVWGPNMYADLESLVDISLKNLEKKKNAGMDVSDQETRIFALRDTAPLEIQLVYVMNNFRMYLPEASVREQVAAHEAALAEAGEDTEEDPDLKAAINEKKRIFAAIDEGIAALGISADDLKKMRDSLKMDKQDPEYKRIIYRIGDLFYHLREQGFSLRELIS